MKKSKHPDAEEQAVKVLLNGVPEEGGNVNRSTLEKIVRSAFFGGAAAEEISRTPAPKCVECGKPADTQCESCEAHLCESHADSATYEDVDICANQKQCEKRCVLILNKKDFCGCCGRECMRGREWCLDCEVHLLKEGPPWERTWFAQFKEDCPFQLDPHGTRPPGKRMAA